MHTPPTRFGAHWGQPRRSAAVLRARAAAEGYDVREASELDCAAAVVAIDAWMLATDTSSLRHPAAAGSRYLPALAAALARAAGRPFQEPPCAEGPVPTIEVIEAGEWYLRWATQHLGAAAPEALRRAAADLSHAGDGCLGAVASLLTTLAESAEAR